MERKTRNQTNAFLIIGMMAVMSMSSVLQNAFAEEGTPYVDDL